MVEVFGYCGECYILCNLVGVLEQDKCLSGGLFNGYLVFSLLFGDFVVCGWIQLDLVSFFKYGMSVQGSMFNEMFLVVYYSIQYFDDGDLVVMVIYLFGDQLLLVKVVQVLFEVQLNDSGKCGCQQYFNVCVGCYGGEGEGKLYIVVVMNGNIILCL